MNDEKNTTSDLPPTNCFACGKKQQLMVRLIEGMRTLNFSGSCRNPNCFRYEDPKRISTWETIENTTAARLAVRANAGAIKEYGAPLLTTNQIPA